MDCFALLAMTAHKSTKETVKTIACGNVGRFRCTRLLVCVRPIPSTREAAGATGTRRSPRPLWAEDTSTARAHRAARAKSYADSSSLRAQRSNPFFLCGAMDCFASLAMTARLDGLLRGAFYRARIRATRWLAMTARLFEN